METFTPEHVLKMQERHKCPYWKINDRTKREVIDELLTDAGLEASKEQLDQSLEDLRNIGISNVYVILYTEKPIQREKNTPAGKIYVYPVTLNKTEVQAIGNRNGYNNHIQEDYFKKLQEIHQEKMNLELEKLRLELTKEDKPTFIQRIGYRVEELISNEQIAGPVLIKVLEITDRLTGRLFDSKTIGQPNTETGLLGRVNKLGISLVDLDKALKVIENNEELKKGFAEQINTIANADKA